MIATIQILISLCAAGTDPMICRHGGSAVVQHIYGPLVSSEFQCQREGMAFLASQSVPRGLTPVLTCSHSGEWKLPAPDVGKAANYEEIVGARPAP